MRTLMQIAEDARRSKYAVAKLGTNDKNRGILAIADTLMAHADEKLLGQPPVSYTHLTLPTKSRV